MHSLCAEVRHQLPLTYSGSPVIIIADVIKEVLCHCSSLDSALHFVMLLLVYALHGFHRGCEESIVELW